MSVDMFLDSAQKQAEDIQKMCASHINGLENMRTALTSFVNETDLKGKTYDSAKIYFTVMYDPIIKGLILITEKLKEASNNLVTHYILEVDENSLQEEVLRRKIQELNQQISDLINNPLENTGYVLSDPAYLEWMYQAQQEGIQNQLDDLLAYDITTGKLFQEVEELLDSVGKGLLEVETGQSFQKGEGIFLYKNLNMDWSNTIISKWVSSFEDKITTSKDGTVSLPKEMENEIAKIKNDKNLTEKEKINAIVGVYEKYLYLNNKADFDYYDAVRSIYGKNSEEELSADATLATQLQLSGIDITAVVRSMGDTLVDVSGRNSMDYLKFIDMVDSHHPLDLKNREMGESSYSIWGRRWSADMEQDYLGNYLFGYYGQGTLKFGDEALKAGAGAAQLVSDGDWKMWAYGYGFSTPFIFVAAPIFALDGYGDNSGDGKMIQEGIDAYKKNY
ncbi:T7SS effector LXG polymorphic toxin [Listeria rustica]|uniref:LXG domain-containing protein n=1 Tax=Listeria rustica TaxID=2713503 RepID=A0A7W1YHG8_9LIST|nr:polymorphic toxin type 44 domain-containing protein [Listeria rustica]MBA3927722.1 hypothetical protein [Listeria rustica]